MAYPVKFMSLQKTELEYEVAIRGETPASTVQELRKQIAKCGPMFPSEDVLTSPIDPPIDLNGVVDALQKVHITVSSTPLDKNSLLRTENLMNHIYHRLNRISVDDNIKNDYDECVDLYKKAAFKLSTVKDTCFDPLASSSANNEHCAPPPNPPQSMNITVTCEGSSNQFFKLKFDGKTCVRAFIQRVDEFCQAKGIPHAKILANATEIFTGDAIHWYRGIRESVTDWDDLVVSLRRDFSPPDYDYRLLAEIRSRTQGESENIVIFLSIMSEFFSRLTNQMSEGDKLEIILHNIRPCYANALSSVSEIKTIEELKSLCRNYENIQSRLSQFKEPPRPTAVTLAPELAYAGTSVNRQSFTKLDNNNAQHFKTNKVYAIESSQKPKFCPRCRTDTHNLRQCTANKDDVVCFVCGRKGFKTPDCPDCRQNRVSDQKN